jgi:hypothetical protein
MNFKEENHAGNVQENGMVSHGLHPLFDAARGNTIQMSFAAVENAPGHISPQRDAVDVVYYAIYQISDAAHTNSGRQMEEVAILMATVSDDRYLPPPSPQPVGLSDA